MSCPVTDALGAVGSASCGTGGLQLPGDRERRVWLVGAEEPRLDRAAEVPAEAALCQQLAHGASDVRVLSASALAVRTPPSPVARARSASRNSISSRGRAASANE